MALQRRTPKLAVPLRRLLLPQTGSGGRHEAISSFRRGLSSQTGPVPSFGIAFDIDGVLLRGGKPIGGAPRALRQLYDSPTENPRLRVPYIFLSNGGGTTENARATELSRQLDVPVLPNQVLLGHTPFKKLVDTYGKKRVLAVGKGEPDVVMKAYGFRQVIPMDTYVAGFDGIDPLAHLKPRLEQSPANNLRGDVGEVAAVFVVSDPLDWGRDLQVICDVLRSGGHPGWGGTKGSQTPLYLAADDFLYQSIFPLPRLGLGAFRVALESIYNNFGGSPLVYTTFGKPLSSVYKDAALVLQQIREGMILTPNTLTRELMHGLSFPPPSQTEPPKLSPVKTIYMIGDNPLSDIKGAENAGEPWFSILTKSGCYQHGQVLTVKPDRIVEDVEEAIHFIFEREGLKAV